MVGLMKKVQKVKGKYCQNRYWAKQIALPISCPPPMVIGKT